ncbi:MAG TPA: translation initiation factor 2, partial [Polyangia bacterium]
MKTITEFSGILLQRAAEAQRAYRAEHPQIATPAAEEAPPAPAVEQGALVDAGAAVPEPVAVEAGASEENTEAAAASGESASASEGEGGASEGVSTEAAVDAPPEPAPDLGTGPEAEAVGAALQVQGDRLSRLMEALDVVGRRVAQVRLVRVIQGETAPAGAQKRGDFFYLVDLTPRAQNMQQNSFDSRDGDRRRGQGGRDRGGPGGNRGSGGPRAG